MSQKYKNFSKVYGQTPDSSSSLLADVKRVGYLRKLKKMKRRFFVLCNESEAGAARLEYYSSEKKWRAGSEPRRSIELKTCLNISRKLHSKQKNVIALYTQDDCFSVVADTPEELELWLNDLLEVQQLYFSSDENKSRPMFEHLWQVEIDKHVFESNQNLSGPYRVALSLKALILIKMNSSDSDYLEFPLMSIRRCGHTKDHFFIELGRSAVTGAGEIYMATEGTIIAQNMHETVLSAMKSSKVREDGNPPPRPRSASTSENSNSVTTRRPVGVITPQTLSVASNNALSNSRERCDSLPTRPKTLSENSNNSVFSVLSSPLSVSTIPSRRLSSRPHSMYEWPSFNSPSSKISSPFSLSSNEGFASSNEDVNSIKQSSSFSSQNMPSDGAICSDRLLTEVPDEYLKMSPSEENKHKNSEYLLMKSETNASNINYLDMKPTVTKSGTNVCLNKVPNSYMSMTPTGNEDKPSATDSYLDMSPSSKPFFRSNFNGINSLERNKGKFCNDPKLKKEKSDSFILDRVPSFLNASELDKRKLEPLKDRNSFSKNSGKVLKKVSSSHTVFDFKSRYTENSLQQSFLKENENLIVKPPIPDRTYKCDKYNSCPPLPSRKQGQTDKNSAQPQKSENFNCKLSKHNQKELKKMSNEIQDFSQCLQVEENSVFEDHEVFYSKNNIQVNTCISSKVSPDQNTNFSCLAVNERSLNKLPCASTCSTHQTPFRQNSQEQNQTHCVLKHSDSSNKLPTLKSISEVPTNSKLASNYNFLNSKFENQNSILHENEEDMIHSSDDYVNLEFKKCGSANAFPSSLNKNLQPCPPPYIDSNYTNVHFGKPFCPTPNPIPATSDNTPFNSLKTEKGFKSSDSSSVNNNSNIFNFEDTRSQNTLHPVSNFSADLPLSVNIPGKVTNIPHTLPAFRKQLSAPATPLSLRAELPSPGRKSSCPVTASASMIKPPLPITSVAPLRPVLFLQENTSGHLRVSTSHSPEHSSISSISSASDEISSNHSSPKILNTSQTISISKSASVSDCYYENVVIPQRLSSRPSSVSSEKELNYASLDLAPAKDDAPKSPSAPKPTNVENTETLLYAEIDFTKSEGLKNTSGIIRECRL